MNRLTVNLIRPFKGDLSEVIEEEYRNDAEDIEIPKVKKALFVYKEPTTSTPEWYKFFKGVVDELPNSMTSPSALLVIETERGCFTVSFGYGRYLINHSLVVPDFGLKVCLNSIPGNKIKTIDKKNLEQIALHTRQQAVIPVDFNTFDIEIERDLIKSVEGHLDEGVGKYLKGASALTITTEKSIKQLNELCEDLIKLYRKETYKNEFGWIDNVKYVQDQILSDELSVKVVKNIREEDFSGVFLGAPEILDDERIGKYRFRGVRDKSDYVLFPSLEQYASTLGDEDRKSLSVDQLKNHKVVVLNGETPARELEAWSVFRCLHAEVDHKSKTYKLLDGDWYEVSKDFLKQIEDAVKSIATCSLKLPNMQVGEKEGAYNIRAATHLNAACLDAQLIKIQGRSSFEFCDIFTKQKEVIHLKKYTGASAMSHLLYQAFVSGQLFRQHNDIRTVISKESAIKNANLAPKVNPKKFSTSDYEVVLLLATNKNKPVHSLISFFSKISLAHKHKVLTGMGYRVTVGIVNIA